MPIGRLLRDDVDSLPSLVGIPIGGPSDLTFHGGMDGVVVAHFEVLSRMPLETSLLGDDVTFSYFGITPLLNS